MFSAIQSLFAYPALAWAWPAFTPDELRLAAILGAFVVLFALEARLGRRDVPMKTVRQSYLTNSGLLILNDVMMSLLALSSLYLMAEHYAGWGVLSTFGDTGWTAVVSFILLDFGLYVWHWACHRFESLWLFHKVHHSDRCVNVSTAFRLHFGEIILSTIVKAMFIVGLGVDISIVLANEAIITLFVLFHHANITFPGERWLSRVIIVPYLHRLHHSARREEHDLNYGAVFSLWDKVFGTFGERCPERVGLNFVKEQGLLDLVKFGFQRSYTPNARTVQAMIAEAAYFRAEKRGFAPGCDFRDWLEAEREISNG